MTEVTLGELKYRIGTWLGRPRRAKFLELLPSIRWGQRSAFTADSSRGRSYVW